MIVYITSGEGKIRYVIAGEDYQETSDDQWHSYQIKILDSGKVLFYRDGSLVYTTIGTVDFETYPSQHIVASGRSQTYPVFIDNILLQ